MNTEGSKAVSRAMAAITIFSILCLVFAFPAFMESEEGVAITCVGVSIFLLIGRAVLKGLRSIVEASELYKERNGSDTEAE